MPKRSNGKMPLLYRRMIEKMIEIDGPFDERDAGTLDAVINNIKLQEAHKINVGGTIEQANYIMKLLGKEKTFKVIEDSLTLSLTTRQPVTEEQSKKIVPNLFF